MEGGGTLLTGGTLVNPRQVLMSANLTVGPSWQGTAIEGGQSRHVSVGDVVVIPAGVPHGWTDIADHVDYLSLRPSGNALQAGYIHPSIR